MALASASPPFELAKPESPLYSRSRFLPPSRIDEAKVSNSIIADGCRIGRNAIIENSVIGLRCIIGENSVIRNSVLMGADEYETEVELKESRDAQIPVFGVGGNSVIEGAIVDGEIFSFGKEQLTARPTAGHTAGGMSLIHSEVAFVGDALFAGSLGGTRSEPAYRQQLEAVQREILSLEEHVTLYPGHGPATTVGEERLNNPFYR